MITAGGPRNHLYRKNCILHIAWQHKDASLEKEEWTAKNDDVDLQVSVTRIAYSLKTLLSPLALVVNKTLLANTIAATIPDIMMCTYDLLTENIIHTSGHAFGILFENARK